MGAYDQRDAKYGGLIAKVPIEWSRNPYILKWWANEHDELLRSKIREQGLVWETRLLEELRAAISPQTLDAWKEEDPLCKQWAWYSILANFARARAQAIGLYELLPKPETKICPLCGKKFSEDSLPLALAERLGPGNLDFCAPCLKDLILGTDEGVPARGRSTSTRDDILEYTRQLTELAERVPPQNFGARVGDLEGFNKAKRIRLFTILKNRPKVSRVRELFGSWLQVLLEAGVLETGARPTARGTQCVARDGHVCLSLGEKTIDDWLYRHSVVHQREVGYPLSNYRSDFLVGDVYIEYFGLEGDPAYNQKISNKRRLCAERHLNLVELFAEDLVSDERLDKKLKALLSKDILSPPVRVRGASRTEAA